MCGPPSFQGLLLVIKEVSPMGWVLESKVCGDVIWYLCSSGGDITSPYLWWALRNEVEQLIACHRLFI